VTHVTPIVCPSNAEYGAKQAKEGKAEKEKRLREKKEREQEKARRERAQAEEKRKEEEERRQLRAEEQRQLRESKAREEALAVSFQCGVVRRTCYSRKQNLTVLRWFVGACTGGGDGTAAPAT
jgi:hypothetical protein